VLIGGETGSGKTTWSCFSLPSSVGATHGLLYYSCTADDSFENAFEEVEEYDSGIFSNLADMFERFTSLEGEFLTDFGPKFKQVFTCLRSACARGLPDVHKRDAAALRMFFKIVGDAVTRRGDKSRASDKCVAVGATLTHMAEHLPADLKARISREGFRKPVSVVLVIDEAGRCPGFVRSIVGQCREIYACFEVNFNIRLVIAFCGTAKALFQRETGPFRFSTDPGLAERVTIVPFANNIVRTQKDEYQTSPSLPPQ
jgi:hypothetical protein